jgi:general secretion pathway protein H
VTDRSDAGFTLLEMVCAVAMVALLAAILLPRLPRGTSRSGLEAYAVEIATLLKSDRNAALSGRSAVSAAVDAADRAVRSGSTGRVVQVPADVVFDTLLPERCDGRPALSTISFFASGMSCGGSIRLTRLGNWFEVRVNWLTGGVDIVARDAL